MTDDERLPNSPDLDDCADIWFADLNEYKLDTQRRQKQVEIWFNASVLVSQISFC
jgi:chromatin-remodeling ATPase INO80